MKHQKISVISLVAFVFCIIGAASAQVDTAVVSKSEPADIQAAKTTSDTTIGDIQKKEGKTDRRRRDEFIPYAGLNINQISDKGAGTGIGYHVGFNYKRGKFWYWQVGARFSNAVYSVEHKLDSTGKVGIRNIDLQVTGGINFLSFVNRVVALRLFVSAVPNFVIGIGENDLGYVKNDLNTFTFYAQGGLGINVAFLVLEAGYNYGFTDLLTAYASRPGQVFVNLGFRF